MPVVQKTLIDGRVYFDRQQDIAGRPALEREKKTLSKRKRRPPRNRTRRKTKRSPATRNRKRRKSPKTCPRMSQAEGFGGAK